MRKPRESSADKIWREALRILRFAAGNYHTGGTFDRACCRLFDNWHLNASGMQPCDTAARAARRVPTTTALTDGLHQCGQIQRSMSWNGETTPRKLF